MEPEQENKRDIIESTAIAVISEKIGGFEKLITEKLSKQDLVMKNIEDQTKATNGHVADAFKEIAEINKEVTALKGWQNRLIGAGAVLSTLVLPVVIWLFIERLKQVANLPK